MLNIVLAFLHMLAFVAWIGGALYIVTVLMPGMAAIAPPERGKLMGAIGKRFTIVSWSAIAILLVTGFLRAPSDELFNPGSDYGLWLLIKHVAILAMILIGTYITFVLAPKTGKLAPKPGEQPSAEFIAVQKRLPMLGATNALLGVFVLFCTVMMRGG